MSKKINLTEKQLKKAINEISYGTVDDANSVNHNLFWGLQNGTIDNGFDDGFDSFYRKLEELEESFEYFMPNLAQNSSNPNVRKITSLLYKISDGLVEIKNYSNEVNSILKRKEMQRSNFDKAIMTYDENNADNDFLSWDDYRKGNINNV